MRTSHHSHPHYQLCPLETILGHSINELFCSHEVFETLLAIPRSMVGRMRVVLCQREGCRYTKVPNFANVGDPFNSLHLMTLPHNVMWGAAPHKIDQRRTQKTTRRITLQTTSKPYIINVALMSLYKCSQSMTKTNKRAVVWSLVLTQRPKGWTNVSQWLGRLCMGVRSLAPSWCAVSKRPHTSWNAYSVIGPEKGYAQDAWFLTLDFVR